MIAKGATNLHECLEQACKHMHREIALFLVWKGVDINNYTLKIFESDIVRLIKLNHKNFGDYDDMVVICKYVMSKQRELLYQYLIYDLTSIVLLY